MSSYKNKNNKGVALILALGVSSVLLTLSMAYVGGAIQENNLCQRYQDSLVSLYEAERGLNYAAIEARNNGWDSFLTHDVLQGKLSVIKANLNSVLAGTNNSQRTISFENGNYGNYLIVTPTTRTEVRTYRNTPVDATDIFILARTTVIATDTKKILKMRIGTTSLYDFLMFTPYDMVLSGIDGKGIGRIHSNGNILWWGNAENVEQVSSAGFMRPNYWNRIPAYLLDGLDGVMDGRAPEPDCSDYQCRWNPTDYDTWFASLTPAQQNQSIQAGVSRPSGVFTQDVGNYPWMKLDWNYNNTKGFTWHPRWSSIQGDFNSDSLQQETGVCPTCRGSYYNWNEQITSYHYGLPPASYGPPYTNVPGYNFTAYAGNNYNYDTLQQTLNATQVSNLFYDAIKVNGVQIPKELPSGEAYDFDPFFQDPVVDDIHSVKYTNTELQPNGWAEWVTSAGAKIPAKQPHAGETLGAVLKDRNTGGEYLDPVPVDSDYFKVMAQTKGIFIHADGSTNRPDLCPNIISKSEFFNDLRPYRENNIEYKDKVVNIDVQKLRTCGAMEENFNGVIYFDGKDCRDCGVRLKNAQNLPSKSTSNVNGGLTVFSTRQVYLQGDFNYNSAQGEKKNQASWQPASIIATNMVYYLSQGFNDPQELPRTVHNINYPQIPDPPTYWQDNVAKMPNQATPEKKKKGSNNTVTYRTAIVSTNGFWQDNVLERWREGKDGVDYKRRIIGAQVQIEGYNTYIPDVWDRGRTIGCCTPILWPFTGTPTFEYDPEMLKRTPPGDFLGGFQASWQEVTSFDLA